MSEPKPITDYVPFYRDSTRAWTKVLQVFHMPCNVPYAVYIEGAREALYRIAYNIISPDPKEIYHQLVGHSLYHDIKASAEESHIVAPREESKITRGLFFIADAVDVALWRMFVFASVADGLIDGSTAILRFGKCDTPHSPNYFSGGPYINAIGDDGQYYSDLFLGSRGDGTPAAGPAAATVGFKQSGFVAASCAFTTFAGGVNLPSSTGVKIVDSGIIVDQQTVNPEPGGPQKMAHSFYRASNGRHDLYTFLIVSAYTGGQALPLHEAFRDNNKWYGFAYSPS